MIILIHPKSESRTFADKIIDFTGKKCISESGLAARIIPFISDSEDMEDMLENVIYSYPSDKICLLYSGDGVDSVCIRYFLRKNPDAGLLILSSNVSDSAKLVISERLLPNNKIVFFGISDWSGAKDFLASQKVRCFTQKQIFANGFSDVVDGLTETVSIWPAIYIVLDMGLVDPAFAPAVSQINPGGLSSREIICLIQRLRLIKGFRLLQISGFVSEKDANDLTSRLVAKILAESA